MLNGYPEHNDKRATTQQIPLGIFITISFVQKMWHSSDKLALRLIYLMSATSYGTKIIVIKMPSGIW